MIGRFRTTVIDCPDPRALASFYSQMLGLPIDEAASDEEWVTVGGKPGEHPRMAFQLATDLRPPRWPDPEHPQQMHIDVTVDDIETAEPRVLALGATRLPGEGDDFRVYADPVGHPFCLCWD